MRKRGEAENDTVGNDLPIPAGRGLSSNGANLKRGAWHAFRQTLAGVLAPAAVLAVSGLAVSSLAASAQTASGSNIAKFCYKPFDDLVVKAKTVSDQAERSKLYAQAQVIFKEQAPWFTIAHAVQLKPVSKRVIDFKLSPFGRHTFYGVDVKD